MLTVVLLMLAAWSDLATRIIPNRFCAGVAISGLVTRLMLGVSGTCVSLGVASAVFLVLALLNARGVLGGGDVKLSAAVVLGLSPAGSYVFGAVTVLAGGLLALMHLTLRLLPPAGPPHAGASVLRRVWAAERWRIRRRAPLPYGVAIACGGAWAVLAGKGI